jgi:polygalacturonase
MWRKALKQRSRGQWLVDGLAGLRDEGRVELKWFMLVWLGSMAAVAAAQDTRVVTEPKVPAVCTRLVAEQQSGILTKDEEETLDTERMQKALDGCAPGHAVELARAGGTDGKAHAVAERNSDAFLTGPLDLRQGVTLLIDEGVTLYGSRNPAVYDMATGDEPKLCGTSLPRPKELPLFSINAAAKPKGGCRALINVSGAKDAAVMGEGTIDGRGYAKLIGHAYSWWEMARKAQPNDDIYYSTKLIAASHADGFVLYQIHLVNSANYHVVVSGTNGFTAWGVHLDTPVDKRLDARNTDGIDPGTSENITIAHSWIDNGDDNIAVKQGVSHMSVLDNHFYDGHGMSIGSETVLGQSFLLVDGLTEDHTTSGIRIKSNVKRGGPVHDLVYRNICMRDVPIPIAISPYYTNQTVEPFEDPKYQGDKIPDYKRITLENIDSETPGDVLIAGLNDAHRTEVTLDRVFVHSIRPYQVHLFYDDFLLQHGGANFALDGVGVKVTGAADRSQMPVSDPCKGKFVPMR